MTSSPSYADIEKQVSRHYRRLTWFAIHVIMAVVSIVIIWSRNPAPQDGTQVMMGLWFGVLICHAVKVYLDNLRDEAIERMWQRYSSPEKPKRFLRLEDDDELEVIKDEGQSDYQGLVRSAMD